MTRLIFIVVALVLLFGIYSLFKRSEDHGQTATSTEESAQASPLADAFTSWLPFDDPEGKFHAVFPTLPQHAAEMVNDPKTGMRRKYDMYLAESNNGNVFMINLVTYPVDTPLADEQAVLTSFMNEMVESHPENQLEATEMNPYNGKNAIDFTIKNEKMDVKTKAFLLDKTVYALSVISPKKNIDEKQYQFFINSFILGSPKKDIISPPATIR